MNCVIYRGGLFSCFIGLIVSQDINAQCTDSLVKSANHFYNEASIGTIAWSNMSNAMESDNSYAQASALVVGDITNYLVADEFNFNISTTAIICGIKVQVERSASGLLQAVEDQSIKIVKNGLITGIDASIASGWTTSDAMRTFGHNVDAWGETWTTSDINSTSFGVAISANLTGLLVPTARIDQIKLTVYYVDPLPLPVELISFKTECVSGGVSNKWEVSSEINNEYYSIERMNDEGHFTVIARVEGAGNSNSKRTYQYIDRSAPGGSAYYRLKQTDFNGQYEYLKTNYVNCPKAKGLKTFPNPAKDILNFDLAKEQGMFDLYVYDAKGYLALKSEEISSEQRSIDIRSLKSGFYYYHLLSASEKLSGHFLKSYD